MTDINQLLWRPIQSYGNKRRLLNKRDPNEITQEALVKEVKMFRRNRNNSEIKENTNRIKCFCHNPNPLETQQRKHQKPQTNKPIIHNITGE